MAKYLIDPPGRPGANLDLQDQDDDTALILAIRRENNEIAKYLIDSGANMDLRNISSWDQGSFPALFVAIKEGNNEIAKYLINKGANIDLQHKSGESALMLAITKKNNEIAKYLINKGANLNFRDRDNYTALKLAIFDENYEIIKYLIAPPGGKPGVRFDDKDLNLLNMDTLLLLRLSENVKLPKEIKNKIPNYIKYIKLKIQKLKNLMDIEEQELIDENKLCMSEDIEELEKCIEIEEEMIKYKPGGELESELIEKYREHPYFKKRI